MKSDFKKMMCLFSSITILGFIAAEKTFATPGSDLNSLKSEIQRRKAALERRKEELERRKAAVEKQTEELDECHSLTRIPETLGDFCKGNDSENLTEISKYLSEFTSKVIESRLGKEAPKEQVSKLEKGTCALCTDQIYPDDNSVQLGCGHCYHSECIQPMIESSLHHEEPEAVRTCPQFGCGYQISGTELASFGCSSNQVLAIQRMLV
jgi:hypothetical protein